MSLSSGASTNRPLRSQPWPCPVLPAVEEQLQGPRCPALPTGPCTASKLTCGSPRISVCEQGHAQSAELCCPAPLTQPGCRKRQHGS